MAFNSINDYTGDGSTTRYAVNFTDDFIDRDYVYVYVDEVETTDFDWDTDSFIDFDSPPADQSDIRIQRITPKTPLVDFVNTAIIREEDLDLITRQNLHISAEALDVVDDEIINLNSLAGTTLGDAVDAKDAAEAAATSASGSASSASTSASNASTSESNAATSESNAATSESNAATSESNAATSESNASTSETNASSSASNAADSETNAAASAASALASANAAATSETNAASSASDASADAASAQGILQNLNTQLNSDYGLVTEAVGESTDYGGIA